MKVNSVRNQSFGLNPSKLVRECIVKAKLEGANIDPLRKIIGELYPYKYMEMLGDYNKVQGINITDVYGKRPRIEKVLSPKWQKEFEKHRHFDYYSRWRDYYYDEEGQKIWDKHAFDDVVGGDIMLYKDLKGKKGFKDIIGTLTTKLEEIRAKQSPFERAMDEFDKGLPEYRHILTKEETDRIASNYGRHLIN